jgi:hypothetical protein
MTLHPPCLASAARSSHLGTQVHLLRIRIHLADTLPMGFVIRHQLRECQRLWQPSLRPTHTRPCHHSMLHGLSRHLARRSGNQAQSTRTQPYSRRLLRGCIPWTAGLVELTVKTSLGSLIISKSRVIDGSRSLKMSLLTHCLAFVLECLEGLRRNL